MSAPNKGRKRTPGPKRTDDIHFRVTPENHGVIRELARMAGKSKTEYLTDLATQAQVITKIQIDPVLNRHLSHIGNNVNQVARGINISRKSGEPVVLAMVLLELKKITKLVTAYALKV